MLAGERYHIRAKGYRMEGQPSVSPHTYQQLDAAYVQAVGSGTKGPHQQLAVNLSIRKPGYGYIYLSNAGNVQRDIKFSE